MISQSAVLTVAGAAGIVDLDRSRANRHHRRVSRPALVPGGLHARTHSMLVLDHQPVAVALRDGPAEDVVVAHEACDELGRRPRRDREWIGDLLDPGLVHDDDPIGHRERLFLVVRDVDEHQPQLALKVPQLDAHAQLQQAVEVTERLVEEQRLRLRHQHAGERDTLLLPA